MYASDTDSYFQYLQYRFLRINHETAMFHESEKNILIIILKVLT